MLETLDARSRTLHMTAECPIQELQLYEFIEKLKTLKNTTEQIHAVSINLNKQKLELSFSQALILAETLLQGKIIQHLRIAIIQDTPHENLKFLETYLLNRDMQLRVFDNSQDAEIWLTINLAA